MNAVPFDASLVFIAGRWRAGDSGQTLPLVNPSDGSELTRIARGNAADMDAAVRAAQVALEGEGGVEGDRTGAWGRLSATERGRLLMKMSALVLEQADDLARMEALDVGKPI